MRGAFLGLVVVVVCLACMAHCGQVVAPGSSTGPLSEEGFSVEVESPYELANVFLVLDPTLSDSNATFSTEVMVTFEGSNVWSVPYVVNPYAGVRNWTLTSCDLQWTSSVGVWGLQLMPINMAGPTTYEIGYVFGVGNETLDERGQQAKMYTEKAVYDYTFDASYDGIADLRLELWGDEFTPDYLTGIYIGENRCPSPSSAVVSYTDFENWDGQPIIVTVQDASHGDWFVLLEAHDLDLTTVGPWPAYSLTMTYTAETDDEDVSSELPESSGGDTGGDEDGDDEGDGIQTWEVVLIIGIGMIIMLVCGALGLFAYMKYKAWQFDKQWDDPVYDTY